MGILNRFSTIMKSNINALLDKCEDPAKMIDQTLLDLRKDLAEVKQETASVMGNAKLANQEVANCKANIAKYDAAIPNALTAGDEASARKMVASKQALEAQLPSLEANARVAEENATKIRQMHDKLVGDINLLESRRSTIKAKVATAKTIDHMNKAVSGASNTQSSLEAFDRMEKKADKMLADAESMQELNQGTESASLIAERYASTPADASVDAELAMYKAKLAQ